MGSHRKYKQPLPYVPPEVYLMPSIMHATPLESMLMCTGAGNIFPLDIVFVGRDGRYLDKRHNTGTFFAVVLERNYCNDRWYKGN